VVTANTKEGIMPNSVRLYFVTDKRSVKTKSYLAVTNSKERADRAVSEIPGATGVISKEVSLRRPQRKRK